MNRPQLKANKFRATSVRWQIVSIAGLISIVAGIDKTDISILAKPLIGGHYITAPILGLANGLFLVAFSFSNVFGGLLVDRLGAKRMMLGSTTWWGVFTALTAIFFAGVAMVPMRILVGLGEGLQGPTCSKWVKEWFPTQERAMAGTIQNAGLWVGPLISGPLVSWLYLMSGSVSTPWLVLGLATLVIALPVIFLFGSDRPEDHRFTNQAETTYIRERQSLEHKLQMPTSTVLLNYRYWIVVFAWAGMATIFYGLTFWFPLYMEDVRHLSVRATGAFYAIPYLLMLVFAVSSSLLSDRLVRRAPFFAIGPILSAVLLLVATHMSAATPALLLISLGLAFNGFVVPNISASLQQFAQPSNIGLVYGIALGTETIVSAVGTYIIGVSFDIGFLYMEAFAIAGGVAALVLVAEGL